MCVQCLCGLRTVWLAYSVCVSAEVLVAMIADSQVACARHYGSGNQITEGLVQKQEHYLNMQLALMAAQVHLQRVAVRELHVQDHLPRGCMLMPSGACREMQS